MAPAKLSYQEPEEDETEQESDEAIERSEKGDSDHGTELHPDADSSVYSSDDDYFEDAPKKKNVAHY